MFINDLLKNKDLHILADNIQLNLYGLLLRANELEDNWGKSLVITSGLRTWEEQIAVYRRKGIIDLDKIPKHSCHLTGQAADILDEYFLLTDWCKNNNNAILIKCGLWCEDDKSVPRLHIQTIPPKSKVRWFKP